MDYIDYNDFIESCQTGDILLYSSRCWYSYFIEFLGWSKFSHVSIIIKDPTWINPELKGLYIFESGAEQVLDVIEDKKIFGVQLVKLEDALKEYNNSSQGYVYYIKNNCIRNESFYDKLKSIILNVDGIPYDLNPKDWIGARFNIKVIHRQSIRFFCSALVAYVLTNLNMLNTDTDWTIIAPREYSYYEKKRLNFINCELEPEKLIKFE